MTIRKQLTRLVIASVLPTALAAVLLITYSYERHRESIAQGTLNTTRALVQAVDQDLASGRSALQALATSPYLVTGDLAAFDRQARAALVELPGDSLVLTDGSGQQLVNTLRPFGTQLPRHGNLAQIRRVFETGRPLVSDLFASAVRQQLVISIDVPVRRDGQVVYDVSMGMLPVRLGEILGRQALPAGWIAAIIDSRGTIVARSHEANRFVGQQAAPALLQRLLRDREGQLETDTLEGIPVVTVFSRSSVSNWSVAIGIPRTQLARQLWVSIAWLIAGTMSLLMLGSLLAQRIGSRISHSIRSLIEPAAALGRGQVVEIPPLQLVEAQELGRAIENAARMLREREEILAIVSHDLRNPLSAMLLTAKTADRLAAKLPGGEPVRKMLATLSDIGRRMAGLVDDLLAVAVSARGKASMLRMTPVNAAALLERAAGTVRPLFERAGIDLVVESAPSLPEVRADEDRVLRVFINLLDNALKFTQRAGRVVLTAREQPESVVFSVSNTGAALPAEALVHMFEPFWQAGEDRRGAGLGLSICRSIVETHGGRIWAEAEPGMCVRMCFELPRAQQRDEASPAN
ncbi:sensor histidine kinase [Ramlibacter ginsenosidimutans]|uniref:histidine kinase n=1 Tax=Ramlibacter ginsenosidimutans TaxID=502333 RepID=A0A934TWK7_9BURK|nr:sensor histidine kinase [Ramlibacter ginsenosidimutans]MBK6008814.1 sensor histidine kinase [Ramlibacter ginsenosidimutans]